MYRLQGDLEAVKIYLCILTYTYLPMMLGKGAQLSYTY